MRPRWGHGTEKGIPYGKEVASGSKKPPVYRFATSGLRVRRAPWRASQQSLGGPWRVWAGGYSPTASIPS